MAAGLFITAFPFNPCLITPPQLPPKFFPLLSPKVSFKRMPLPPQKTFRALIKASNPFSYYGEMAHMDPEAIYAQLAKLFGSKNPLLIVSNPSTPNTTPAPPTLHNPILLPVLLTAFTAMQGPPRRGAALEGRNYRKISANSIPRKHFCGMPGNRLF
jgi:hypothetical protein